MAYMVGVGLNQSSYTIIGKYIGKGDAKKAKIFYSSF